MRMDMAETMRSMTIVVKLPHFFGARIWLGTRLMYLGARVLGCCIVMEKLDATAPTSDEAAA